MSLDAAAAAEVRGLLLRLLAGRPGLSMLSATHHPAEAATLADRVPLLGGSPANFRADVALPIPREGRNPAGAGAALRAALEAGAACARA